MPEVVLTDTRGEDRDDTLVRTRRADGVGAGAGVGSAGNIALSKPVVGLTADPAGRGYRMVASDGGTLSFGAPFYGSFGANPPASPIVAMASSIDGNGYYLMSRSGQIWAFGDAVDHGNA